MRKISKKISKYDQTENKNLNMDDFFPLDRSLNKDEN